MRDQFLDLVRNYARYWAELPDKTPLERCEGLAFSLMVLLDGNNMSFPAVRITVNPHEDDLEFAKSRGENWYKPGLEFNQEFLHDLIFAPKPSGESNHEDL